MVKRSPGRPASPVLVQGKAVVWVKGGFEAMLDADIGKAAHRAARLLFEGKLRNDAMELEGVIIGKGMKPSKRRVDIDVEGFGTPAAHINAVVATGRLPGIPCTFGNFAESDNTKMWFCQFGRSGFPFWHRALGLPPVNNYLNGVIVFTSRGLLRKVRHELYEMRKGADGQWL